LAAVIVTLIAGMTLTAVGTASYRAGLAQGIAESGKAVAGGPMPYPYPPPYYGHHGPFGWGFGGILFPLFVLVLVFGVFRRRRWAGGCGDGRWRNGVPPAFEDWHRRAHESMADPAPKV
jgi:hypothetical protein